MKKVFMMLLTVGLLTVGATAQTTPAQPSKEEKAKMKAQKEQALNDAIKELGLTKEVEANLRKALEESDAKSKEIKNDAALTEAQKEEKKEVLKAEKNAKLKEILGEDQYKKWNAIRKKQKDAMPAPTPAPAPAPQK